MNDINPLNNQITFDCLLGLTGEDAVTVFEDKKEQKAAKRSSTNKPKITKATHPESAGDRLVKRRHERDHAQSRQGKGGDSHAVKKADDTASDREFPLRCLGPTLGHLVTEVAHVTQTPPEFGASLSLAVANSAIQGKIKIALGAGTIVPNSLYIVATISPGENKESVYNIMTSPLHDFQASSNEVILTHDIALGELAGMMHQQSGRATVINLNGTFALASRRNTHVYQSFFLNAFSGLPITFERSNHTIKKILNPMLTIFLAGPPELLPFTVMPKSTMSSMSHCFLFVPCDSMLGYRDFSFIEQDSIKSQERYNQLISALLSSEDSGTLTLNNAAKAHLKKFGKEIEFELQDDKDAMYSWNSQLLTFVCRIVRILHCCKHPHNPTQEFVDEQTLINAIQIVKYYQMKAKEAFGIKEQIKEAADREYLLQKLIDLPDDVKTTTDLLKLTRSYFGNIKNLEECLEKLAEEEVIQPLIKQRTRGKPRKLLAVNPVVLARAYAETR